MKTTLAVVILLFAAASARAAVDAEAGPDRTAGHARSVSLAGTSSVCTGASIPCTYAWTQTSGTTVSLSNANTATATFTAPTPAGDNVQLTFRLTVTGADSATSFEDVNVGVVKTVSTTDDEIVIGNASIARLVGRQLMAGSSSIPFTYFDTWNANGLIFAAWIPDIPPLTAGLRGKVNVTNGSTAVTCFDSSCKFTEDVNGATGHADFQNNIRIKDAAGWHEVKVASINSNTSVTLQSAWAFATSTNTEFDTQGTSPTAGMTTQDWWLFIRYYDLAYCLYVQYYRTGLQEYLTAARRVADCSGKFGHYREGRTTPTSGDSPPPREAALEGLMIRNLESGGAALPWVWDWAYEYIDDRLFVWHEQDVRVNGAQLYDPREQGYVQLYAALLARVLPNVYPDRLSGNPDITNGASKRGTLLGRAETSITSLWEDTQFNSPGDPRDGLWLWDDTTYPSYDGVSDTVMMGALVEGMAATYDASTNATVRSKIVTMMRRLADAMMPLFRTGTVLNPPSSSPSVRYRALWPHAWGRDEDNGGGDPVYTDPSGGWGTNDAAGQTDVVRAMRQSNAEPQILWGFVYRTTGVEAYKTLGDDAMGGSFGDAEDTLGNIAQQTTAFNMGPQGKMWDQNYRRGGVYLVDRLSTPSGQSGAPGDVKFNGKVKLKGKVAVH